MELKPLFQNIADAIREKDGTADPIPAGSFPARIQALPSGPVAAASLKEVNFFDYDGALVYSCTLAEAQALTALPRGPVHDGLVFQGWNWTLEKVKALTRPMNVGAMYITDDGKTRLKIRVWDKARSNVPLYISQTVTNGVTIDWGDGSGPETLDGTGNVNTRHQYAAAGDYTITLEVADGCVLGFGNESSFYGVFGSLDDSNPMYGNRLLTVHIGKGVTSIGIFSFCNCYSLEIISLPNSVLSIGHSVFRNCYSLKNVSIPNGVPYIGNYTFLNCQCLKTIALPNSVVKVIAAAFQSCGSLASITFPNSITVIEKFVFKGTCRSLVSISIPESVTSIGEAAFQGCSGMAEYHLNPVEPPALADVNALEGIPSDCVIYVPKGSLKAYKTAANWSTYAGHMREEPA